MARQEINWDRLDAINARKLTEYISLLHVKVTTVLMAIGCGSSFVFGYLCQNREGFIGGVLGYVVGLPLLMFLTEYPRRKRAFDEAHQKSEDEFAKIDAIIAKNKAEEDMEHAS